MAINISKLLNKLLEKFLPKFILAMGIDYTIGSTITLMNAKRQGVKTTSSPLTMTKQDQEANTKIIGELVKGVNDDMAKKINYLTNKSITEKWSNKQLEEELKGIFKKDDPNHFNYKNRFKTIAFNESNRLLNNGAFNKAQKLKATGKYLGQGRGNPFPDSLIALGKYGSPEKAIPLNKPFEFTYKKQTFVYMFPPNRPNDSELVFFTFD